MGRPLSKTQSLLPSILLLWVATLGSRIVTLTHLPAPPTKTILPFLTQPPLPLLLEPFLSSTSSASSDNSTNLQIPPPATSNTSKQSKITDFFPLFQTSIILPIAPLQHPDDSSTLLGKPFGASLATPDTTVSNQFLSL